MSTTTTIDDALYEQALKVADPEIDRADIFGGEGMTSHCGPDPQSMQEGPTDHCQLYQMLKDLKLLLGA